MKKWPERQPGWENALLSRTRAMLEETAERFGLRCEWEFSSFTLSCRFPRQAGLDFDLCCYLSDDEFVCSGEHWYADIFPADDEQKWGEVVEVVEGLISGDARVLLYHPLGRAKPYWTEVQLCQGGKWRSVSTGLGLAIPPVIRATILKNGTAPKLGKASPAYGSLVALSVIGAAVYIVLI